MARITDSPWAIRLRSSLFRGYEPRCEFQTRAQIIWSNNNFAIGRGDDHWQDERSWYAVRRSSIGVGDRKQTTVWNIACLHKDLIEIASHRSCCRRIRVVDPK